MNIGVFDTGMGGRLVADRLSHLLPNFNYIVIDDKANAPYGERSSQEITSLTDMAIQPLLGVTDTIILACNTVTAVAVDSLRNQYPETNFIGLEPMIKPAAKLSQNKHITLLATTATKRSKRIARLINDYAPEVTIDTPETTGWATLIDQQKIDSINLSEVANSVASGSDVIILGCTHYLALEDKLNKQFPDCHILEPSRAIARQISQLANSLTAAENLFPRS